MDKNRLISTFCDLVRIPSESPDDKEFIAYMEKLLQKEGAKTVLDDFGNLVAKLPAKNSSSKEPIMFCCHGDTVKPGIGIEPVVEEKIIRSKGNTILGGDDKAGIAEIIEMLRSAKKHPPLEVVITRCEEIAPAGAEFLDYSLIDSKMGYVLDMDTPSDVITGGPTCIFYTVKFKGVPAHSGVCPEKGISAIQVAAEAICNLRLGRIDAETTANVGVIKGGLSMNIIPEDVELAVECRSLNNQTALKVFDEMKDVFTKAAKKFGAELKIDATTALEAYSIPKDAKVVQLAVNAMKKNGVIPDVKAIAGGTDATHINHKGIQTAVLGIGGRMMHSTEEYVVIDELIAITNIITTIVEDLA